VDFVIEDVPPMRVATVRHVGPYSEIGEAIQQAVAVAEPAGLLDGSGAIWLGMYYDDPRSTPAEQLRSDAGFIVPDAKDLPSGLKDQVIAGGRYARATYVGAYDGLPGAWVELRDALATAAHRTAAGPSLEIYRSDMATTPRDELRTDLYVPLE
jgi:AraC family transcriptional regulator